MAPLLSREHDGVGNHADRFVLEGVVRDHPARPTITLGDARRGHALEASVQKLRILDRH